MDRADRSLSDLTGYRLRRATIAMMAEFNAVFAAFGLRRTTFSALTLVVDNPGMRQSELAEALAIERPNIVQIVDELERAGLVRRKPAPEDRRAYALQASAAGKKLHTQAMAVARQRDLEMTRGLSADQIAALHHALRTIQANALAAAEARHDDDLPQA